MPARTASSESDSSQPEPTSIHSTGGPNNRWRFNGTGQFVDSEAAAKEWDLADEIVRLNISGVGDDAGAHGHMRTPPKVKMGNVGMNEGSPLETSSDASPDSSPNPSDGIAHSRGSSTSSTRDSGLSRGQHFQASSQLKVNPANEAKERPHSFSGGLSAADMRRLQQAGEIPMDAAQWSSAQFRDTIGPNDKQFPPEQPTYPSLINTTAFPRANQYSVQSPVSTTPIGHISQDLMADYQAQQRSYNPTSQQALASMGMGIPQQFSPPRPASNGGQQYRQPPRGFNQQGLPSPTSMGYPGGHTPHLSLGNAQQLYEMMQMHPDNHHPAVARVQQQHNVFRPTHHHSASDPSAMRDAAAMALLSGNMPSFGPGTMYSGMPPPQTMALYASQYYAAQEAYPHGDLAAAQAMANRLQPQYTGYGPDDQGGPNGTGPSANNRKLGLYKTELCRSWEEKGTCRYGAKCQFAHGEDELRKVARHPKYKTEICRTFWVSGSCPYGKRCCFIHTELPASGAPPGADGAPPPQIPDTRARSLSTNSDPNEQSVSLLARISAKRKEESSSNTGNPATPVDASPSPGGYQFTRPATGSLRVDTSVLDPSLSKQNKSAYPSFASNVMLSNDAAKSPVPVTAGPDLGSHNRSRLEIVGYNQRASKTSSNSNVRHSFNGSEVIDDFATPTSTAPSSSFRMASPERNGVASQRTNGHSRSGSAGNWGSFSRSSLGTPPYPQSSGANGELKGNSPWSTTELAVGSSRLNEKAWA
ncbi:hypothetical protein HWV62_44466 [Athelia sp. TMB]|nr:hypothetical protein HWV62_44466 [Athelia sp. TMB]